MTAQARPMSRRAKVLLTIGGVLLLGTMLVTGVNILTSPPKRVLVVTMVQDAVQADRVALKAACGGLPGVKVVKDIGNPAASIQGRFPVRFDIATATFPQETALTTCINAHGSRVRGFLVEGDN
jgi:hypothetical protein